MKGRRILATIILLGMLSALLLTAPVSAREPELPTAARALAQVPISQVTADNSEEITLAYLVPFASNEGAYIQKGSTYTLHFVQTANTSTYSQKFILEIFSGTDCTQEKLVYEREYDTLTAAEEEVSTLDESWDTAGLAGGTYTVKTVTAYKSAGSWIRADSSRHSFLLTLTETQVPLTGIRLQDRYFPAIIDAGTTRNIVVGETISLNAAYFPQDTTDDRLISFTHPASSAVSVLNHSGICEVTGARAGSVEILAECGESVQSTASIQVHRNFGTINTLTITQAPPEELFVGQTGRLLVEIDATNGLFYNSLVNFLSSDKNVLTVDATGCITAVGTGSATITAAVSGKRVTSTFTVSAAEGVADLQLNDTELTLCKDAEHTLVATAQANDGTQIVEPTLFTWSSSDTGIAAVSKNGIVTTNAAGTASITVSYGERSVQCAITVTEHAWDLPITLVDAAAHANGQAAHTCTQCGYFETYATAPLHTVVTTVKQPTCTEPGGSITTCPLCDYTSVEEVVPALGHEWTVSADVTTDAPEEHRSGRILQQCARCHATEVINSPALHEGYTETIVIATCTEDGYTLCDCPTCGFHAVINPVPATGHDWSESVVTLPPGAHTYGKSEQVCNHCGKSQATSLPPTDRSSVSIIFQDIKVSSWYEPAVNYVYTSGYFSGVSENNFEPQGTMTRSMLVSVLYRMAGKPSVDGASEFRDVADGSWYTKSVIWASSNGIVSGVGAGKFNPNGNVSREQIATILYRYAGATGEDVSKTADLSGYPDVGKISSYARTAMEWAVEAGIISGQSRDGAFYLAPLSSATRAEVSVVFMRYIDE